MVVIYISKFSALLPLLLDGPIRREALEEKPEGLDCAVEATFQ